MKHILPRYMTTTEGKFFSAVALIFIALFGYYFYSGASSVSNEVADITVSATDHVRGAQGGKVTLVEFGDFQCPACGVYEPIVRQVLANNSADLKFVFRNFPLAQLHKNALLAATAAEAAGLQGKFWEMHDMIYDKQSEWSETLNAKDHFLTYATTLGLDTKKFQEDLKNKSIEDKILAEYKEGIRLGVQGTPTFFLNGQKLEGPLDLGRFDSLVKAEIAKSAVVQQVKK